MRFLHESKSVVTTFIKSLLAGVALLGLVAFVVSKLLSQYHLSHGLAGLVLMGLNAFAAVAFLQFVGKTNFIRTSLLSMVARLFTLAIIMVVALRVFKPTQAEAFSFVFTAMAGYVFFQTLEIRHFIRQGMLR